MSNEQFIYVMKDLRKLVPPKREVLKGIWLSFFHGAKIGVVGPNGSGKSTLLRIMAGLDDDFLGEAWAAKGTRVSYLPQEPELDPELDVRGNVEEAVRETRELLKQFEEISMEFAEPMSDDEMEALIKTQSRLQDRIDASNAWDLERKGGDRHGRPAPASSRCGRHDALRRRKETSGPVQGTARGARHAPP